MIILHLNTVFRTTTTMSVSSFQVFRLAESTNYLFSNYFLKIRKYLNNKNRYEIPSIFGILFQFLLLAIVSLTTYAEGSYHRNEANSAYRTACLLTRIVHNSRRG